MAKKAFVIGANGKKLKYAVSGAEKIAAVLRDAGYSIIPELQETSNIKAHELQHIFSEMVMDFVQPDDVIIFYFSGHGTINNNNGSTLHLLLDSSEENKLSTYLSFSFIADCLSCSPSQQKLVILDCCEATDAKLDDTREGNYVFIRATKSFQKTKEIDGLQSSFLTYHLHSSLLANQENPILLSTLRGDLQKAVKNHNELNSNDNIPKIPISGREDSDFEIIQQKSKIGVFISYNYENTLIKNFAKDLSNLLDKKGFNVFLRSDIEIDELKEKSDGRIFSAFRKADIVLIILDYEDINIFEKNIIDEYSSYNKITSLFDKELASLRSETINRKTLFLVQDTIIIDIEHDILFTRKKNYFTFAENQYEATSIDLLSNGIKEIYNRTKKNSIFLEINDLSDDFKNIKYCISLIGENKFNEFIKQLKDYDDLKDDSKILLLFTKNKLGDILLKKFFNLLTLFQKTPEQLLVDMSSQSESYYFYLYIYLLAVEERFINKLENNQYKEIILDMKKGMELCQ